MKSHARTASLSLAAALIASAPGALANGRFPAAGQIAVHPGDTSRMLVRTTFGFVVTGDRGGRWDWICEAAVGYGGAADPFVGVLEDGTMIAGLGAGLNVSHDEGCGWAFAAGPAGETYVVDVSVDKSTPSRGLALLSEAVSQVFESTDDGRTWAQAGVDLPEDVRGQTLDAAPSSPDTLYVTARTKSGERPGALVRSFDRGKTWETLVIPGADDGNVPYLGAIDPVDPATLYVRTDGDPVDRLLVSHDSGETWDVVLETQGMMLGFALSPDGSQIVVGGPTDGMLRAETDALVFEKVSEFGPRCLTWAPGVLYACGDQFQDTFTVGMSEDAGETWTTLMLLADTCGPLACPEGTSVAEACEVEWSPLRETISGGHCDGAGGGAGGGGATAEPPAEDDPGCGCGVVGASSGPGALAAAALLAALAQRRRLR
jgi:MYXO-CTERM domain-containing protein